MAQITQTRMIASEFLYSPESKTPAHLIDGEVIVSPSPVVRHQLLSAAFYDLIKRLVTGGTLLYAPIDVWFDDENVAQPDVLWMAPDSRCKVSKNGRYLEGAPELIVEVFSPGTARLDRGKKFNLYQRHGVREYWMVDPAEDYVEVWELVEGKFTRLGVFGPDESFQSPLLGVEVVLAGVFPE